jgi:isoquinoline 1-oxidoreductase
VAIDAATKDVRVLHVCEAFECGAIINPDNLRNQVEGAITMGLGPALTEEMKFKDGVMENAAFRLYRVPHFRDVPTIDVRLVNRTDLPSVGAGETPIIAIAPAIANAVYHATGQRIRSMPIRLA